MRESGDRVGLEDAQEKCMGGTVLVWVLEAQDIGIAKDLAKALCRSVGIDPRMTVRTMTEVAEKGADLLRCDSGGLLMLCPRGAEVRVEAIDFLDVPRRGGARTSEEALCASPL
jgi:hypothetical protein